jgi:hypothetical protein
MGFSNVVSLPLQKLFKWLPFGSDGQKKRIRQNCLASIYLLSWPLFELEERNKSPVDNLLCNMEEVWCSRISFAFWSFACKEFLLEFFKLPPIEEFPLFLELRREEGSYKKLDSLRSPLELNWFLSRELVVLLVSDLLLFNLKKGSSWV